MLDISVVICAYTEKRWHEFVAAVGSVRLQSLPAREIIVVIDHNPGLWKRVQVEMPGVVAVENTGPRGLSGARNTGVACARGAVIAFMDEDAVAAPDWLERLRAGYEDPEVLGVGGAIEPLWQEDRPRWFPEEFDWVVGCTYRGMPETAAPVRNLIGCNMSFRRGVFEAVGGFRSGIGRVGTLPVGCEETEFCIRASQSGLRGFLWYEPRARVFHRVPQDRAGFQYFRARCFYEGRSKAIVARLVGQGAGLATERSYTFRTLPKGVTRSLAGAVMEGDLIGLGRAGAIVCGLFFTTAGYISGSIIQNRSDSAVSRLQDAKSG